MQNNDILIKNQSFVAGALAFMPLRGFSQFYYGLLSGYSTVLITSFFSIIALPLAIGIYCQNRSAILLAKTYLLLMVILQSAYWIFRLLHLLPASAPKLGWNSLVDLLAVSILLALLYRKEKNKSNSSA